MSLNKVYPDPQAAVSAVFDGAVIMVGGFGRPGLPNTLVKALIDQGTKELVCICNTCHPTPADEYSVSKLIERGQVRKVITTFPGAPNKWVPAEELWRQGKLEVEVVLQGVLTERMRAAAAGLGGFFVRSGVETPFAEGRQKRSFEGVDYILETPLKADFALIQAHKGDTDGNLVYRLTQRNYNPTMAAAADVTIVEIRELVQVGQINPEEVITPGIYVDRLVVAPGDL